VPRTEPSHRPAFVCRNVVVVAGQTAWYWKSPPPKLMAPRRTRARSGTIVLMAEDQSPLFQIIGGYFDSDAVPGKGFDPIPFHSSGGIGDELMSVVEPNAITGVRQYLGHETIEFQEVFL
jgi:hypothetical protein